MALAKTSLTLGDVLVREGIISPAQLQGAVRQQQKSAQSLGRILVDTGLITEAVRMAVLQKTFDFELIDLKKLKIDPLILNLIPAAFSDKHSVLPIRQEGSNVLVIAMEDPSDLLVVDAIKNQVGLNVKACLAPTADIREAIRTHYAGGMAESHGVEVAAKPKRRVRKILGAVAFPIILFLPLLLFFLLAYLSDGFLNTVLGLTTDMWELSLYVVLSWGLWAILTYEANSLIFADNDEESEE